MSIKLVTALAAVLSVSLMLCAGANAQQRSVKGVLEKNAAVGGETPGWAVRLDEPYVIGGRVLDVVEVYAGKDDLSPLEGKHITATGTFVEWRTPERGKFLVLEICDITPTGR